MYVHTYVHTHTHTHTHTHEQWADWLIVGRLALGDIYIIHIYIYIYIYIQLPLLIYQTFADIFCYISAVHEVQTIVSRYSWPTFSNVSPLACLLYKATIKRDF
jgi:hypothetical protein